jgi:hypothetical protein
VRRSMCMHRFIRLALGVAVLLLPLVSGMAVARERVVISGTQPSKRKVASLGEGRTLLFGPVKLTQGLKEAPGVVYVVLEGVTFDPSVGSAAELYLVDAAGKTKQVEIDPTNYVGSAANVAGGKPQVIDVILEINDFMVGDKEFKVRTRFRTMDQVFLALVIREGRVRFRRAVITTEAPTEREASEVRKEQPRSP